MMYPPIVLSSAFLVPYQMPSNNNHKYRFMICFMFSIRDMEEKEGTVFHTECASSQPASENENISVIEESNQDISPPIPLVVGCVDKDVVAQAGAFTFSSCPIAANCIFIRQ